MIHALLPHQGASVMLDTVANWDPARIVCRSRRHLDLANPLRHAGRLGAICGVEFALQAAALHGGLLASARQPGGVIASLRALRLLCDRLDDDALGTLVIQADRAAQDAAGMLYAFALHSEAGDLLLDGRAAVALSQK